MAGPDEPEFDLDDGDDEFAVLTEAFHELVDRFAEEHEVSPGVITLLALELSVTNRMAEYLMSVEKPSGSGLKRELERYGREMEHMVRAAKKRADQFVAVSQEAVSQARAEEEGE
jgi:uncharacterized protein (DUF2336 family)